ncbi:S1 family peptidase [Phreatobacter sp. AB_2022a]|uniref:S1 family peptidase n=1 Tax=Phreatobacter sp. AB_2022a TaxID=3003134 RepID=UPI0022875484|nr:trypsin-like serine protease [Phreatobacter sp. AB_2022a]MCZ0737008.1 trypsin-like serine protease [Phreatobacter sp. AB_2022a]
MRFLVLALALMPASPALAVIGGTPLSSSDPVASQTVMISGGNGFCSGAVVGERLVLTAAHCVEGSPRLAVLVFGPNRQPILNEITARAIHPAYRRADWQNRRTAVDLAVVRTAEPIGQGRRIAGLSAAPLPAAGATIRLVGYGPVAEGDGASAGVLREVALTVTGRPSSYQVRLTAPAGARRGACTGDSGGPVFATEAGQPVVAGIVSWSTGQGTARCGTLTGTVPVAPHRRWIEETIQGLGAQR